MKADIASFLSGGELFIGLTGVQNTRYLEDVVRQLKPKRILECVDMDCRTNPHVQGAGKNPRDLYPAVRGIPPVYLAGRWQKGIDDYLLFEKLKREHLYRAA